MAFRRPRSGMITGGRFAIVLARSPESLPALGLVLSFDPHFLSGLAIKVNLLVTLLFKELVATAI